MMMHIYCLAGVLLMNSSGSHKYQPHLVYSIERDITQISCNYPKYICAPAIYVMQGRGNFEPISVAVGTY